MRALDRNIFKRRPLVQAVKTLFNPKSLFNAGEQGVWYDPSDLTTLFQDSAGTTPVTAVEQPVGLMLDKSKNLAVGPELLTNGDFSNGSTGWTLGVSFSVVSSQLRINSSVADNAYQTVSGATNQLYLVEFDVISISSGTIFPRLCGVNGASITSAGRVRQYVFSGSLNSFIGIQCLTGTVATVDNISVRELPGNHAFQSTSVSRPVLSARVNLLTKTEQFDDAAWTKTTATITANATTAPDGTLTADRVEATGITPSVQQDVVVNSTSVTLSAYFKKGTGATSANALLIRNQTLGSNIIAARVNLDTGAITYLAGSSGAVSENAGNGWWKLTLTASITSGNTVRAGILGGYNASVGDFSFIWGADLRPADQATGLIPQYQRVNTSTDYDTAGFPLYLKFNGTSSSMATNSINFTATDKMTVWAGMRKLSDAASGMLTELSSSIFSFSGAFNLLAPSGAFNNYQFSSAGSAITAVAPSGFVAPITNVLTGIGNISGDQTTLRINGTQVGSNTGDQGTGNYGNYPLYIGARAGTSLYFNGHMYGLIVRAAQSTASQIASGEKYINSKTKAY